MQSQSTTVTEKVTSGLKQAQRVIDGARDALNPEEATQNSSRVRK